MPVLNKLISFNTFTVLKGFFFVILFKHVILLWVLGISYTLPALGQSNSSDDDDDDEKVKNNPLDVDFGEDNGTSWLESMGVGKETLPQLKQSKIKQQRVKLRNIDHQGSSVAVVTGSDTQALFNYLLNCKSLVAKTGNLAGIPPTLLAPVAFEGATLQSLLAKQGKHLNQVKYKVLI